MRAKEIIERMHHINDGSRPLFESVAVPEVIHALKDWAREVHDGILIGGLAMGYHGRPRATFDVDILFLTPSQIPLHVEGFKRIRPGAFLHKSTHVEVEVLSPQSINLNPELAEQVAATATQSDGIKVASPSGIVALKLQRLKRNDIGDIVQMIETGHVDLSGFTLSLKNMQDFEEISTRFV